MGVGEQTVLNASRNTLREMLMSSDTLILQMRKMETSGIVIPCPRAPGC